jgi:hypothetical protein
MWSTFQKLSLLTFVSLACIASLNTWATAQEPTGVWRGEWRSGSTGHHGPMRAVVQPKPDGNYQARFTGRFAVVIPFAYRVTLQPGCDANGNPVLTANKPLGPILGSYRMNAQTMGNQFSGDFQAAGDNGSIKMRRVR